MGLAYVVLYNMFGRGGTSFPDKMIWLFILQATSDKNQTLSKILDLIDSKSEFLQKGNPAPEAVRDVQQTSV